MEYLSCKDYARLKGCSVQYVKKIAKEGKIDAVSDRNPHNGRPMYMIPVTALPHELQVRYYRNLKQEAGVLPETAETKKDAGNVIRKRFEELSETERNEINLWTGILYDWQDARNKFKRRTEADELFVSKMKLERPDIVISTDILYRKWAAYKEGNLEGLCEGRGGWNKGMSSIPTQVWQAFLSSWLSENQPPLSKCYRDTMDWTMEFFPDLYVYIPSEKTFRRHVESDIKVATKVLMREGEKAFSDRCLPYVHRLYDQLEVNECWIADNHTLDVMSINGDGAKHRLTLTSFMDAKTGVLVGWNICDNPNSDSTIVALRHGIMRMGCMPKYVYFDNGREFLTHDVGGRGHRAHKNDDIDPPTILQRLGIEMRNAIVRNAKAKPIERFYYTFKMQFSKSLEGYVGGNVLECPKSVNRRIKEGKILSDTVIRQYLGDWIDGDYNQQLYGGCEAKYSGMSRIEVWNTEITHTYVRTASESELNLMMMRAQKGFQLVKRSGVFITIYGQKVWYYHSTETISRLGESVAVRYDPEDLSNVRIYDKDDRYIGTWGVADAMMVNFMADDKEQISDAMARKRRVARFAKTIAKGQSDDLTQEQKWAMLDRAITRAVNAKHKFKVVTPTNIIPVRAPENMAEERSVVGGVEIDRTRMAENALRRKEEKNG